LPPESVETGILAPVAGGILDDTDGIGVVAFNIGARDVEDATGSMGGSMGAPAG